MSQHLKIISARKKKGLFQEQLAALTNVTVRTIQRIENAEPTPGAHTLKALAAALDFSFEAFTGSDSLPGDPAGATPLPETLSDAAGEYNFLQLLNDG